VVNIMQNCLQNWSTYSTIYACSDCDKTDRNRYRYPSVGHRAAAFLKTSWQILCLQSRSNRAELAHPVQQNSATTGRITTSTFF